MKSAIHKEYIVQVKEDGSVVVFRIFDNVKASLREAAESVGFEFSPTWGTRQFGSNLIKKFGHDKMANVGCYVITERDNGSIETYRTYENTKSALREIAQDLDLEIDKSWGTRQLGSKLIDFINK